MRTIEHDCGCVDIFYDDNENRKELSGGLSTHGGMEFKYCPNHGKTRSIRFHETEDGITICMNCMHILNFKGTHIRDKNCNCGCHQFI